MHTMLSQQVKSGGYPGGHAHNPEAPFRNKYPEDYDSSSDYEVRKIGDMIKQLEDHRKQLENAKKSIIETNKESQASL